MNREVSNFDAEFSTCLLNGFIVKTYIINTWVQPEIMA
jgi:hypothetical protein